MKDFLKKILDLVNGKKASIAALAGLTVTLLLAEGLININWAIFIQGILSLLGISVNVANARMAK